MNNGTWEGPDFKGVEVEGVWRDHSTLAIFQERGCLVLEESELARDTCPLDEVEKWLSGYWIEHDIRQLVSGIEQIAAGEQQQVAVQLVPAAEKLSANTMALIRQHEGLFQMRLFSASERYVKLCEQLRKRRLPHMKTGTKRLQ